MNIMDAVDVKVNPKIPALQPGGEPLRQRQVRLAISGAARPDGKPVVPELPLHRRLAADPHLVAIIWCHSGRRAP